MTRTIFASASLKSCLFPTLLKCFIVRLTHLKDFPNPQKGVVPLSPPLLILFFINWKWAKSNFSFQFCSAMWNTVHKYLGTQPSLKRATTSNIQMLLTAVTIRQHKNITCILQSCYLSPELLLWPQQCLKKIPFTCPFQLLSDQTRDNY